MKKGREAQGEEAIVSPRVRVSVRVRVRVRVRVWARVRVKFVG